MARIDRTYTRVPHTCVCQTWDNHDNCQQHHPGCRMRYNVKAAGMTPKEAYEKLGPPR